MDRLGHPSPFWPRLRTEILVPADSIWNQRQDKAEPEKAFLADASSAKEPGRELQRGTAGLGSQVHKVEEEHVVKRESCHCQV